jgi:hypothetical protein
MENKAKSPEATKATASDAELGALINLAGVKPEKTSPLSQAVGKGGAPDNKKLLQSGLVDSNGRPTADCLEALNILASPDAEVSLLWGAGDRVSLSKVYFSARSKDKLVSYTRSNGIHNLAFFLTRQDITDLITEKTAFPPINEAPDMSLESGLAALPAFFSALDLFRESQLKAALERRQSTDIEITAAEINRIWQSSKMEIGFEWYAPAGYISLGDGLPTGYKMEDGLNDLKRMGIVSPQGLLSTRGIAFAGAAFPLISFVGIKSVSRAEKTRIGLFRGFSTLLLVQLTSEDGADRVFINSITTSQIPELLFNLATRPFEVEAQPATAAPKLNYCPKCGDPVKSGEKFCDKCGARLQ